MTNKVELAKEFSQTVLGLKREISKVIIGQDDAVDAVLTSLFSNGHCLLVGVPGLAKTLLIKTIAEALDLSFNRVQFTPDLMPSDITGSEILDSNRAFKYIKGPIFANIVLADEINRTPPKTQAALLEAMQEKSVTTAGKTYNLPLPFFVLATQNPIEQEGTYPLPEAQLDRFMFNIVLDYPVFDDEIKIIKETTSEKQISVSKIANTDKIIEFQSLVRQVPIADNVIEYAVSLVAKTRPMNTKAPDLIKEYISYGAGPRAGQYLVLGAKCNALIRGKISPDIEDIQAVAFNVLRHRIVKNYKAESDGISIEQIIQKLF
ncbi:MAG: MoxR family ATPase [Bacteroidetes bacterium]|nr:MoxR family ATPase [Bacteroidota bacterium]